MRWLGGGMLCLALACMPCLQKGHAEQLSDGKRPMTLAYYYTWYTTAFGKHGEWAMWTRKSPCTLFPDGTDPDALRFPPAIRRISSCAYPLIGPYDSDNKEVVRWHIRLAKAAGIDAFLVDVWGKLTEICHRALFDVILPVAEQEGFKVAIYDEAPQFGSDVDQNAAWAVEFLEQCKDSPAYLHIDDQPVYGVYQVWEGKMTPEQGRRYFKAVEDHVGDVYWIVDRIVARPGEGRPDGINGFQIRDGWAGIEAVDAFSLYATFSNVREYRPSVLVDWYKDITLQVHALSKKILLPVHPGLDSRAIQLDEVAGPERHWTIPRAEGKTLRGYLHAAETSGADFISVTSFNEWPETTCVEPAMTWPNPYLYLQILADFAGLQWDTPPLPPIDVLDPAVRQHVRTLREQASPEPAF